jgi:hypothetical protein
MKITKTNTKKELINYAASFYGKGQIYSRFFQEKAPNGKVYRKYATIKEITQAVENYIEYCELKNECWGTDTVDRENVRDIMLQTRGFDLDLVDLIKQIIKKSHCQLV